MERWLKNFGSAGNVTGADKQGKEKKSNDTNDGNRNISATPSTSSATATSVLQSQSSGIKEFDPKSINRIMLKNYPMTNGRSFCAEWFKQYTWLEYHPEKDAALCFACRVFSTNESKELSFSKTGFKDWKHATEKKRGFPGHDGSNAHRKCMIKWNERETRINTGQEVSTLVNDEVLAKHRYYVESIFEMIRFLVVNQLPLRGSYVKEEHVEKGLFQALFKYTLTQNDRLREISYIIPANATYLSGDIQNEMISCMAACVKRKIIYDIENADVPFFCLMADGTKDKNNQEAVSIVLRFVKEGKAVESLLSIEEATELTALYLKDLLLNTLRNNGIDLNRLLCQCYDGASVMKGWKGGVQALMETSLNRSIPYVHCFNHQLHLIVVHIVKLVPEVKQFFDYCSMIHKIFSTFKFKSYYDGHRTCKLMDQRWTGHLNVTEIIHDNYQTMLKALVSAIGKEFDELDGITVVECTGLLTIMRSFSFRFVMCALLKLLKTIEPVDTQLQKKESGLASSLPVINAAYNVINDYRSEKTYQEILDDCNDLSQADDNDDNADVSDFTGGRTGSKRKKIANVRLSDYILTESSGLYHISNSSTNSSNNTTTATTTTTSNSATTTTTTTSNSATTTSSDEPDDFKRIFFEIIDVTVDEMNERFIKDQSLFHVIDKVYNLSFEKVDELERLRQINGSISIPSIEEIVCVKRYMKDNGILTKNFLSELYKQKSAFKKTYELYATVCTFACSSATCEASFSCLNRILTPSRQSMLFGRESNLTILPYEKHKTETVTAEELLREFHNKSRRLQVY